MQLFWNNLGLIILKLEGEWRCLTSCVWCNEWLIESSKWYWFESLKNIIEYSLDSLVSNGTKFFLYWKNVFKLSFYDELISYILAHPEVNFDFHLTSFLDENDFAKLEKIKNIDNLSFTFCQSYSTIDKTVLEKLASQISSIKKRNQIVLIVDNNLAEANIFLDSLSKYWDFELTISRYPIFIWKKATNTGNSKCLVLGSFIPKDDYIDINKSVLLEILPDWKLRLHNYLCNLASIDITNVFKEKNEILKDFKKFIYFFHKFHMKWNYETNCYKCIKKINYSYDKTYAN
jgi:hypothetical protein